MRVGEVRVTVPMFGSNFEGLIDGARVAITDDIWLASLDAAEQDRTRQSARMAALSRFEFFNVAPDFDPSGLRDDEFVGAQRSYLDRYEPVGVQALRKVNLLALTARLHPNHQSALADVWTGDHWHRIGPLHFAWSPREGYSYFPMSRMDTFRGLLANWPSRESPKLALAFSYYLDSIAERQSYSCAKSLTAAAIAAEILLDSPRTELKRTFRQRGAHLVSHGADCFDCDRQLSELYDLRSAVVHRGRVPSEEAVHLMQQWLMAALPAVAAIGNESHDELLRSLDRACYEPSAIAQIHQEGAWWRFVDFAELCRVQHRASSAVTRR